LRVVGEAGENEPGGGVGSETAGEGDGHGNQDTGLRSQGKRGRSRVTERSFAASAGADFAQDDKVITTKLDEATRDRYSRSKLRHAKGVIDNPVEGCDPADLSAGVASALFCGNGRNAEIAARLPGVQNRRVRDSHAVTELERDPADVGVARGSGAAAYRYTTVRPQRSSRPAPELNSPGQPGRILPPIY